MRGILDNIDLLSSEGLSISENPNPWYRKEINYRYLILLLFIFICVITCCFYIYG